MPMVQSILKCVISDDANQNICIQFALKMLAFLQVLNVVASINHAWNRASFLITPTIAPPPPGGCLGSPARDLAPTIPIATNAA